MCQIWCDAAYDNKTHKAGLGILIREIINGGIKETKLVKIKPIEPDCACYIKTNQDLAECLIKYQEAIKN